MTDLKKWAKVTYLDFEGKFIDQNSVYDSNDRVGGLL